MQFNSVRASAKEGVSGLERVDDFQRVQKQTEVWAGFHFLVPGTLPLNVHVITSLSQGFFFLEGGFVDFFQSTVFMADGKSVALNGKAAGASMPQHP